MEDMPQKAKLLLVIYAVISTLAQTVMLIFGVRKEDFVVVSVLVVAVLFVSTWIYVVLYFRNYRYSISDKMIVIKKGALFKRRHLVYVDRISCITIKEKFVHRHFKLCTVWFYVQGSVIRLPFVSREKSTLIEEILDSRH